MIKNSMRKFPSLVALARKIKQNILKNLFPGSSKYWEKRYGQGGTSGSGSYGKFAKYKAEVINDFIKKYTIQTVIEFGCGDGNQLSLAQYPNYIGLDVSKTAIRLCQQRFQQEKTKQFFQYLPHTHKIDNQTLKAELSLSLDVIYHLIEDEIFELYLRHLFAAAKRFVIIYSSNTDEPICEAPHVKHRNFSIWIAKNLPEWILYQKIVNKYPYQGDFQEGSFADFYIYQKMPG